MDKRIKKNLTKITKEIANDLKRSLVFDDDDNLTIKLTTKEIKSALRLDPETKDFIPAFKPEFLSFLSSFREYSVEEAEKLNVQLDLSCPDKLKEIFLKAWKRHFGIKIIQQNEDVKWIKRHNLFSLLWGMLSQIVVIGVLIICLYVDSKPIQIVSIILDCTLSIVSWVFIWECISGFVFTSKEANIKLLDYYLLYSASFFVNDFKKPDAPAIPYPNNIEEIKQH